MEKKQFLEAAKIINTHGLLGTLKLECLCDDTKTLCAVPSLFVDGKEYRVLSSKPSSGGIVLSRLEGVNDIDEAMKFKGKFAFARRGDIKKKDGTHFIADLIGLDVIDAESGKKYGVLSDIQRPSKQEIFYIDTGKATVLMPNVPDFVKEIDEERGIFVTPIEGFFEET